MEERKENKMNKEIIVTKDLSKTYGKGELQVHALRKTTISIKQGDYIAIVGPSGSGKSTLMNLIGCQGFIINIQINYMI